MMDKLAIAAVEQFVRAGYPLDAEAILLAESDGTPEEVANEIERMEAVLARERRDAMRTVEGRGRAPALLGRSQGGVPGGGPDHARLLLHGRHDSARQLGEVLRSIASFSEEFGLAAPTCSTPATATCTR
jgi:glycolate oxidase